MFAQLNCFEGGFGPFISGLSVELFELFMMKLSSPACNLAGSLVP